MNHFSRFLRALSPICAVFVAGATAVSSSGPALAKAPSFGAPFSSRALTPLQPRDAFVRVGVPPTSLASTLSASGIGGFSILLGPTAPSASAWHLAAVGDSTTLTFDSNKVEVNEGDGTVTLTVTRATTDDTVKTQVDYTTVAGTATEGADYSKTSGFLTFNPGATTATITVPIIDDNVAEPTQAFTVTLSNPTSTPANPGDPTGVVTIGNSPATIQIIDNDSAVQFVSTTATVNEGAGNVFLTLKRTGDTTQATTVNFATTDGTATAGQDYTAQDTTVTFPADTTGLGQTPQGQRVTVSIPIADDTLDEINEDFTVTLSTPGGNSTTTIGTNSTETVTIVDNDTTGVGFDSPTYEVDEGVGLTGITINVVRSGDTSQAITVPYQTQDGTALAAQDYTASAQGSELKFAAGQTTNTINIPIINDTTPENTEDFQVKLLAPRFDTPPTGNLSIAFDTNPATVSILDDDPAVNFASTSYSVNEADGTVTVSVTRSGPTTTAATVNYSFTGGSATNGQDYTGTNGTLTFPIGDSTPQTIVIPINNDTLNENTETFNIRLSNPVNTALGPDFRTTVSILDDDPIPTITIDDVTAPNADNPSLLENDLASTGLTFRVNLSAASGRDIFLNFTTSDGSATDGLTSTGAASTTEDTDYTATKGPVIIPAGTSSITINVPVTGDSKFENDEAFLLTLLSASNATITRKKAVGNILNDDTAPSGTFNFSPVQPSVAENDPNGYVTLNVTRTNDTTTAASVTVTTADGTAIAGSDYTAVSTVLSFKVGDASQTVQVPIFDDSVNEADETFTATLSNPQGFATLGANPTATVTITNDDAAPTLTIGSASVTEGDSGTVNLDFPVTVAGNSEQTLTVHYATKDGTATVANNDYVATSGTLSFAPGDTTKTISVVVNGDTAIENTEAFSVLLTNPQNATLSNSSATGTIVNDDTAPTVSNVSFVATSVSFNEAAGSATLNLRRTTGADRVATIDYATSNGTATAPADYTAKSGTVTFAKGMTTATITVPIINDTLKEPGAPETFKVTLSNPGGNAQLPTQRIATVSIVDNEGTPTLSIASTEALEGNSGLSPLGFTVSLFPQSNTTVKVQVATTTGGTAISSGQGQDYRARTAILTFSPGQATQVFSVDMIGDTIVEPDETVKVLLSNPQGAPIASGHGAATGTIDNDDQPGGGGTISFLSSSYAFNENVGTATITLGRTGRVDLLNAQSATVHFATGTGSATPGQDYRTVNTTVTFPAGETTASVLIPITDDAIYEGDETVSLAISNPSSNAILGAITSAILTITDNDPVSSIPRADSITPTAPVGSPFTVKATYSIDTVAADTRQGTTGQSVDDLAPVLIQIGGATNGSGFRALYYPRANYLTLDPSTGQKVRPGTRVLLTNQFGSLDAGQTTVQRSGSSLIVTWTIRLSSTVSLPIYLGATGPSGQSVFVRRGTWRPASTTTSSTNGS